MSFGLVYAILAWGPLVLLGLATVAELCRFGFTSGGIRRTVLCLSVAGAAAAAGELAFRWEPSVATALRPAFLSLGLQAAWWVGEGPPSGPTESLWVLLWLVPWAGFLGVPFAPDDPSPWLTWQTILAAALALWVLARAAKDLFHRPG